MFGVRGGSRTHNTRILSAVTLPIGLRGLTALDHTIYERRVPGLTVIGTTCSPIPPVSRRDRYASLHLSKRLRYSTGSDQPSHRLGLNLGAP